MADRGGATDRITSLSNATVKAIRGLWLAKNRKRSGLFLAEGLKLVLDAIEAGWAPRQLVHADRIEPATPLAAAADACRADGGAVIAVSEAVLAKIAKRDNPQSVIGVFAQTTLDADDLLPGASEVWVALEGIRDPGNLGTIIRTCDAVGAAGILLGGYTVDPFGVETVRATMGSIFHVPLARMDATDFVATVHGWPGPTIGTHLAAKHDYREVDYAAPLLLVMGAEQSGLTEAAAAACSRLVKLPMAGKADSLNLAVATGVLLYEARRKDL